MKHSKAIVTLAIGQKYLERWQSLCKANWQKYANKHGYDIICIDTPLDNSERAKKRSPSWQKCLILSQDFAQQYERIVWIDSDILINSSLAPCIVEGVPVDRVGAVDGSAPPTPELCQAVPQRRSEYLASQGISFVSDATPKSIYIKQGLPPEFNQLVQAGVMVLSPHHHREVLEKAYFEHEQSEDDRVFYELVVLSYELLKAEKVHWIDYRFNLCWADYRYMYYPFLLQPAAPDSSNSSITEPELLSALGVASRYRYAKLCATTTFINSFFLHFAGCAPDMALVDQSVTSWQDCTEERMATTINNDLARIYTEQGQSEQAIALYQQSLELQDQIGDIRGKAATLQHLADSCARQGQINEALTLFQNSLKLQEQINDVRSKAATLTMTGQLFAVQGDLATALSYLQQSLEILQGLNSSDAEAVREIMAEVQQMAQA